MKEALMGTRIWMIMAGAALALLIGVIIVVALSGGSSSAVGSPDTSASAAPATNTTASAPVPTATMATTATTVLPADPDDMLTVAAEQFGMPRAALTAELQAGKSIAEVASERGGDVSAILDTLLDPRIAALEAQVASGQITQAIADRRTSMMRTTLAEQLSRAGGPQPQGPGQGPGMGRGPGMGPGQGRGPGMGPGMQPGQGRGPGMGPGQGQCSGPGYADSDGDGICDNAGTGRPTP
jgi:hypothetical protein